MSFIGSHPLASAFIRKFTNGTGGIPPLQYEIEALNYWCWENEKNGLLGNYVAYYPMICGPNPGTAQSIINMSYNLISPDPFTATTLYNLTANNITGSMCTVNGYQGNGTSSYWNTNINASTVLTNNNIGLSFYNRTTTIKTSIGRDIGCDNNSTNLVRMTAGYSVGFPALNGQIGIPTTTINLTNYAGYYTTDRTSSTLLTSSYNGLGGTQTNSISTSNTDTLPNLNLLLGAGNHLLSGITEFSMWNYGSFSISNGFSLVQRLVCWNIEQTFQKMLGRAISF